MGSEPPSELPSVSVILCTYDIVQFDHFMEAAYSVLDQNYPDIELVVIVDGSQPLYEQALVELGGRSNVKIRKMPENRGLLECRNMGVQNADSDIVAFMDDDAVADESWIDELVVAYEEEHAIAAGGRMVPQWIAGRPNHLPEEFYWIIGVTHKGFPEKQTEVRNTFGSNISFRRDVFTELGGFNTDMGGRQGEANLQGGETELCSRMQGKFGSGVIYMPDAVVAHKVFEYRTRFRWQLDRAFWQGYSKRAMSTILGEEGMEESEFLKQLVFEHLPKRCIDILTNPSRRMVIQLVSLCVFSLAVGAGYLYGILKW